MTLQQMKKAFEAERQKVRDTAYNLRVQADKLADEAEKLYQAGDIKGSKALDDKCLECAEQAHIEDDKEWAWDDAIAAIGKLQGAMDELWKDITIEWA